MLAHHRLIDHLRIIDIAVVVAVDAQPGHLVVAGHLVFTDYRCVVFSNTSHHASLAAGARVEIDVHAPVVAEQVGILVTFVERVRVEFLVVSPLIDELARELRQLRQFGVPNDGALGEVAAVAVGDAAVSAKQRPLLVCHHGLRRRHDPPHP